MKVKVPIGKVEVRVVSLMCENVGFGWLTVPTTTCPPRLPSSFINRSFVKFIDGSETLVGDCRPWTLNLGTVP